MRLFYICIGLWLFASGFSDVASALESSDDHKQYSIERWSDVAELPASIVNGIITTENGYLWFATDNGLVRYDGVQFFIYNRNNFSQIIDNTFIATVAYGDSEVLAINNSQIIRIRAGTLSTQRIPSGINSSTIRTLSYLDDGSAVIGTHGDGIFIVDRSGNVSNLRSLEGLPSLNVNVLHHDYKNQIWIGTDKGVAVYKNGQIERLAMFGDNYIQSITTDSQDNVWFGSKGMGVFHWADNLLTQYTTGDGLSSNNIRSIAIDADGAIWFGTGDNGLNRMEGIRVIKLQENDGLPSLNIDMLAIDRSGSIWAGTERLGVSQLKRRTVGTITTDDGLPSNLIHPVYQDINDAIWIGSYSEGVIRLSGNQQTVFNISNGLDNNRVQTIYGNDEGTVWIGTANGINQYKDGILTKIDTQIGQENISVRTIFSDLNQTVWVGTNGNGLYQLVDGKLVPYRLDTILDFSIVTTIYSDKKGNLWIGTLGNGFGIISPSTNTISHYNGESELPHNHIYSFLEDSRGAIWIGTGLGLVRFDDGIFEVFTPSLGLLNNEFFTLFEDSVGNIWSTSNNGIQYFSLDEIDAFRQKRLSQISAGQIGLSEGLPTRQFNNNFFPTGWKISDGSILLSTMRGVVTFDPIQAARKAPPVNAIIERLVSNEEFFSPIERPALEAGTLAFEIEYTAPEFYNAGIVRFRYRLLGFDDSWTDAGSRRTAYYSGLKPGNYSFEVQATLEGQAWNGVIDTMSFKINPYFYQSKWFIILLTLGVFAIGYSMIRLRIQTIREKELEKMVEARTKQLQMEIQMHKKTEQQLEISLQEKIVLIKEMHHRVKNNLTLIYALFELQISKIDDKNVATILSDSQFRLKSMAMLHEQLYQNELLANIQFDEFIQQLATGIQLTMGTENITLKIQDQIDPVQLDINQSVPLGLLMNELITNAFKHAFKGREKGQISISLSFNDPDITLNIKDNGNGLPTDIDISKTDSLGLELVSTLVNQLNGTIDCEINGGTSFTISFRKDS
jgi:two-component sensor histidine kinase/ligand-binding sensor domain-containing protein